MHLRQPKFVYNACGPFTKNIERIKKFKEAGDSWCIYQNLLHKAYFQLDMHFEDFNDFPRGTAYVIKHYVRNHLILLKIQEKIDIHVDLLQLFTKAHGKTTEKGHTGDIWVHRSDKRVIYKHMQVTYGWHTSIYKLHPDDIRVHTDGIRLTYDWHTNDLWVTYGWHTSGIQVHMNDIRMP